ncbi:hypothetical protein HRF87_17445 [Bacillus sp. CRN 9]|nr:hypothetical protein [Bacillus sp. CRN 9]
MKHSKTLIKNRIELLRKTKNFFKYLLKKYFIQMNLKKNFNEELIDKPISIIL